MADIIEEQILDAAIARIRTEKIIREPFTIRQASRADVDQICIIAKSATEIFTTIPALADLLEDENLDAGGVYAWLDAGRICVVADGTKIIGFAAAHVMDGALYIDEISTRLEYQGKGIGGYLIKMLFEWARESNRRAIGAARVSLLTFADVSWNKPWYARRGFREVEAESIGSHHVKELWLDANERGLTRPGYRRCAMIWEDDGSSAAQEEK